MTGDYDRYRAALRGEPLPAALVDLDALEHNVDALVAPVRAAGKTVRVASKSVRCVALLRAILARGGAAVRGLMAFSPEDAVYICAQFGIDVRSGRPCSSSSASTPRE